MNVPRAAQTVHVWASKECWKPRQSRLREQGTPAGEIADLASEVAAARARAELQQEFRTLGATDQSMKDLLAAARQTAV